MTRLLALLALALLLALAISSFAAANTTRSLVTWPVAMRSDYLRSCSNSALASLRRAGRLTATTKKEALSYCTCTLAQLERKLTLQQFEVWVFDHKHHAATSKIVQATIAFCGLKVFHP